MAARLTGSGTSGSPLDLSQQSASSGQVLKWSGAAWTPGDDQDSGDVTGPASAADNAVARFDGATGKLIQSAANVVIDDSGKVGIGTTAPTKALDIQAPVMDGINLENTSGQRRAGFFIDSTDHLSMEFFDTTNTAVVGINTGGDSYFTAGNFGIGTTNPSAKLEVNFTENNDGLSLKAPEGYNSYIRFHEGSSVKGTISHSGYDDAFVLDYPSSGYLTVTEDYEEVFRVMDGVVGIGVTSPDEVLHLRDGALRIGDDDGAFTILSADPGDDVVYLTSHNAVLELNSVSGDDVSLAAGGGRVGVGNTEPQSLLHVAGEEESLLTVGGSFTPLAPEIDENGLPNLHNLGVLTDYGGQDHEVQGAFRATDGDEVTEVLLNHKYVGSAPWRALSVWGLYSQGETTEYFYVGGEGEGYFAGNVGIGVPEPDYKLDVDGSIHLASGAIVFPDGSQMNSAGTGSANTVSNTADLLITADSDAEDGGEIQFNIGGEEQVVITNDGDVGIGNDSPSERLDVAGSITTNNYLKIRPWDDDEDEYGTGDGLIWFRGTGGTSEFKENSFIVENGNWIVETGVLGVGTTDPAGGVDVSDGNLSLILGADNGGVTRTDATEKVARIVASHWTNAEEPFAMMVGSGLEEENLVRIGGGTTMANAATSVAFYTAGDNTTTLGTERMLITAEGAIGVGTTDPTSHFDVLGGKVRVISDDAFAGQFQVVNWEDDAEASMAFMDGNESPTGTEWWAVGRGVWDIGAANFGIARQNVGSDDTIIAQFDGSHADGASIHLNGAATGNVNYVLQREGANKGVFGINGSNDVFIGDSDQTPLVTIEQTGKVGIGTTGPETTLHVKGDYPLAVQGSGDFARMWLYHNNTTTGYSELSTYDANTGKSRWAVGSTADLNTNSNMFYVYQYWDDIGGTETLIDKHRLVIDSDGDVGIGTASPGFPLNFSDDAGDKIALWGNSGAHYGFGIQSNLLQIYTDASDSSIAFGFGSSGSFTETARITGIGGVGIGTNSPATKLHVYGGEATITNNEADNTLKISAGTYMDYDNYATLALASGSGDWDTDEFSYIRAVNTSLGGGYSYTNLTFGKKVRHVSDDTDYQEFMRITNTGKVGIGTTAPEGLLSAVDPDGIPALYLTGATATEGDIAVEDGDALQIGHWNSGTDTFTERVRINSAGRVGIGTSSPSAGVLELQTKDLGLSGDLLDTSGESLVLEGSDSILGVYSEDAGDAGSAINLGEVNAGALQSKWSIGRASSGTGGSLHIGYGTDRNWWNNDKLLTVTTAGNVGIGITSPDVPLHVEGGSDVSLSDGGYFAVGLVNSTNLAMDNNEIMTRDNGSAGDLYINKDGGNVAIGGGPADAALDVYGAVRARDGVYTYKGTATVSAGGSTVTVSSFPSGAGIYMATVHERYGLNYRSTAMVYVNADNDNNIVELDGHADISWSISGSNLQVNNASGESVDIIWSVLRLY